MSNIENPGIDRAVYSGIFRDIQGHSAVFSQVQAYRGTLRYIEAYSSIICSIHNCAIFRIVLHLEPEASSKAC